MARSEASVGIKDVARAAGVSVGTVSNVLNRPDSVSESRRAQVRQAIESLGYVPNNAARQLKAGVSRAVGLVVMDSQNPFYGTLALEAEAAAEERGLGLFVANSHHRLQKENYYLSQFEEARMRGVLMTPSSDDLTAPRAVVTRGTSVILVDSVEASEGFCSVAVDDFHGGFLAVSHLIATGRRRILVVGGPPQFLQVGRRRAGAVAAAEGSEAELTYLEPDEMSILAGRAIGERMLDSTDGLPDAVFAMNDLLAIGILQALVMNGRARVPDDIALVGYDDIDFCASAIVPITSVSQPSARIGREAIQLLVEEVEEGDQHEHRSVILKPELVVRESTAASPQRARRKAQP